MTQMRAGQYEQALQGLQKGVQLYPDSALLRAGLAETRAEMLNRLLQDVKAAHIQGRLDEAERLLARAAAMEPDSARVQEVTAEISLERRQKTALADAEALLAQRKSTAALALLTETLKADPRQPELLALKRKIELTQRQTQLAAAQIGLAETRPISLDFRDANLRTVLDVVSRNSGINFILDKDIRPDARVTVFLRSAKVEEAIDLITSTNQLAKKLIDSRTMLVYPNTPEKRLEHQEQVVKVFYLASGDAKGAAAFLKSMLKVRDPYVDERTNMLALRDSQENVQMAERLIAMFDAAEPEVLLEVEVIEINKNRLTELGVRLPDSFALSVLPPESGGDLTLANVRGLTRDRIGLSVGGVTVNLKRETGDFNTLANPRIRVRNKEKARILVGDKIPVVSATTGQTGFVSENITYLEVGLKLEVEPTVYIDDEVAIKIGLEVSSLGTPIKTTSGSLAYQIGTRNATTLLRLRDGETQLLAGLINSQERSNANRVPGLGDLPMLGRLFSSTRDDNQHTEIVLSITPRVLRNLKRPDVTESEMWVGTDNVPRLRPVGGLKALTEDENTRPLPALSNTNGPQPGVRAVGTVSMPAQSTSPIAPSGPTTVSWSGPAQAKVGDLVNVSLELQAGQPLRGFPLRLSYSKNTLRLLTVEEGEFFKQGGAPTNFTHSIDAPTGSAGTAVLRNGDSGASGHGKVATFQFQVLAAGDAEVRALAAEPVGMRGALPALTDLPSLSIQVK